MIFSPPTTADSSIHGGVTEKRAAGGAAAASANASDQLNQALGRETADLPPLPLVANRLVSALGNTEIAVSDIIRLISMDPGIAAKVLRLVNSGYYGFPRQVTTLSHAIVILGFNAVRNLALTIAASDKFALPRHSPLDATASWEHAIGVALCAQLLAKRKNLPARAGEEAFLGGLLHDIGKTFLCQHFPTSYRAALAAAWEQKCRVSVAEQTHCGATHSLVGKRIAEKWNLPATLATTIWRHHEPVHAQNCFEVTALVHAGDALVRAAGVGFVGDPLPPVFAPEVANYLQMGALALAEVQEEMKAKVQDARNFLQVAAGD